MELLGKTPEQLDRMTLSEIEVAAIDVEEETQGKEMSWAEIAAYQQWWKSLSDLERLEYGE